MMNAVAPTAGMLFVVFALSACSSAMAQSPKPPVPAPSFADYEHTVSDDCHDDCRPYCRPYWNDACPSVYAQVEALLLMREPRFARQPIVVDDETGATLMSTSDLGFNYNPGLRATVGHRLHGGRALEFTYFGFWQGGASAVALKPNEDAFLIFPDNLAGNAFVDMDLVRANYASRFHSFEVNMPCCCGCCDAGCCGECGCGEVRCRSLEWFAGFRYINLGEDLGIATQRTVADAIEEGAYNIRTANHLYGGQLGARVRRTRGQFGWEAAGKAGLFGNDSQQRQAVTDFPNVTLRSASRRGGAVAFVGEVNLSALYILTDVWNVRAGYNALWIEGVALAPDQLDFNFAEDPSGNQLRNGGGMLLHGVNLGLEARW